MTEAEDANVLTITALAEKLGVPVPDVAKAARSLALTNTVTQPWTAEDAALVEQLVRLDRG
jgi:type III secretory pathway component EscU